MIFFQKCYNIIILYHNKRHQVTAIRQYASKLRPDHIFVVGVSLFLMEGENLEYTLELELDVTSVGWAVLTNDTNGVSCYIKYLRIRIFEAVEQSKTVASIVIVKSAGG